MDDILQPLLVIAIGGLFAPILTQLLEKLYGSITGDKNIDRPATTDAKSLKRKKWLKFFCVAIIIQLVLFSGFFFLTKATYFDKNYFMTSERELIKEGIKKDKSYIIPKITIRIFAESKSGVPLTGPDCNGKLIGYCTLLSISYEIVALKDFNSEKLFSEYYDAIYAADVVKQPGSEIESEDKNPKKDVLTYDLTTTLKKYERRTVTTRADFLYESLPPVRKFFNKDIAGDNFDMFYYPNNEDDVIGEVEFQVISRSLKFENPTSSDFIYEDETGKQSSLTPSLVESRENGGCINFSIISAKIPRLKNNEKVGLKWSWMK